MTWRRTSSGSFNTLFRVNPPPPNFFLHYQMLSGYSQTRHLRSLSPAHWIPQPRNDPVPSSPVVDQYGDTVARANIRHSDWLRDHEEIKGMMGAIFRQAWFSTNIKPPTSLTERYLGKVSNNILTTTPCVTQLSLTSSSMNSQPTLMEV